MAIPVVNPLNLSGDEERLLAQVHNDLRERYQEQLKR